MKFDENKRNINILRNIIQENKKVIAIVGAGTSKTLGIKNWLELLEDMNKEFGSNIDITRSIVENGYPRTATIIYNSIEKKIVKNLYNTFMHKQFETKITNYIGVHMKIFNIFKIILTTNYDTSFEQAFDDRKRIIEDSGNQCNEKLKIWKLPYFEITEIFSNLPLLVYLHGNNEKNRYVFLEDEYKHYYPSYYNNQMPSELENFLRDIFNKFYLVFIGFSFNDDHFCKFYERVIKEFMMNKEKYISRYNEKYQLSLPKCFVIISNDELKTSVDKKEIMNIFGKENNSWENLFINNGGDELFFKKNADEIMKKTSYKYDLEEKIRSVNNRCRINQDRSNFFKRNNINIIRFEGKNFKEIENILKKLRIQDVKTGKNLELEVKNVI